MELCGDLIFTLGKREATLFFMEMAITDRYLNCFVYFCTVLGIGCAPNMSFNGLTTHAAPLCKTCV